VGLQSLEVHEQCRGRQIALVLDSHVRWTRAGTVAEAAGRAAQPDRAQPDCARGQKPSATPNGHDCISQSSWNRFDPLPAQGWENDRAVDVNLGRAWWQRVAARPEDY